MSLPEDEVAYALVTPYSLHKSRTGGIIARLLWANVHLAAARMYAPKPGSSFITDYCDSLYDPTERAVPLRYQKVLIQYVLGNFSRPNVRGISNRLLLLVFRGPNAQSELVRAVGHIGEEVRGDDVRGTFGDFVSESWSNPQVHEARRLGAEAMARYPELQKIETPARCDSFFEPAVLAGATREMTEAHLKLFRRHAYCDGGYVLDAIQGIAPAEVETSMVILKPESFRRRNPLPGNLVDFFARTGMYITGAKMLQFTPEQAREFYSLKVPQFTRQLKGMVEESARRIVSRAGELAGAAAQNLGTDAAGTVEPRQAIRAEKTARGIFREGGRPGPSELKARVLDEVYRILAERLDSLEPPDAFYSGVAEELKALNAGAEFDELIRYMTGKDPQTGQPAQNGQESMCMALLYSGADGLKVIRKRLSELRKVYGRDILQNRAHASDPEEDPVKEVEVVGMPNSERGESRPCDVEQVVDEFYGSA